MRSYFHVLRNYAHFSGRATRKEYWSFVFFNPLVLCAAALLTGGIGVLADSSCWGSEAERTETMMHFGGLGAVVYSLLVLLPSVALAVRRMHDTGRSGWWLFVPLMNFIRACQRSQPGENRYGRGLERTEPVRAAVQTA